MERPAVVSTSTNLKEEHFPQTDPADSATTAPTTTTKDDNGKNAATIDVDTRTVSSSLVPSVAKTEVKDTMENENKETNTKADTHNENNPVEESQKENETTSAAPQGEEDRTRNLPEKETSTHQEEDTEKKDQTEKDENRIVDPSTTANDPPKEETTTTITPPILETTTQPPPPKTTTTKSSSKLSLSSYCKHIIFKNSITIHIPLNVTVDLGIAMQRTRKKRRTALTTLFPTLQRKQTSKRQDEDDDDDEEQEEASEEETTDKQKVITADGTMVPTYTPKKKLKKTHPTTPAPNIPQPQDYASVLDYLEAKYVRGVMVPTERSVKKPKNPEEGDDDDDGDNEEEEDDQEGSVYSESSFLDDTDLQRNVAEQVLAQSTTTKMELLDDDGFFVNVGQLEVEETELTNQQYDPLDDLQQQQQQQKTAGPPKKKKKKSLSSSTPSSSLVKTKKDTTTTSSSSSSSTKKRKLSSTNSGKTTTTPPSSNNKSGGIKRKSLPNNRSSIGTTTSSNKKKNTHEKNTKKRKASEEDNNSDDDDDDDNDDNSSNTNNNDNDDNAKEEEKHTTTTATTTQPKVSEKELKELKQKALHYKKILDDLFNQVVAMIQEMSQEEMPREKTKLKVSLTCPPSKKPGDEITFKNPHIPGQRLRVKIPKKTFPGGTFKVTVPVKAKSPNTNVATPDKTTSGDDSNVTDHNKFSRTFQELVDDYARAYDDWCHHEGEYMNNKPGNSESTFHVFSEKKRKFEKLAKQFPNKTLMTPVTETYLRKLVRRARQNKHKRIKTAEAKKNEIDGIDTFLKEGHIPVATTDSSDKAKSSSLSISSSINNNEDTKKEDVPSLVPSSSSNAITTTKNKEESYNKDGKRRVLIPQLKTDFPRVKFRSRDFVISS